MLGLLIQSSLVFWGFFRATSNELLTFSCAALKPNAIVIKQAIKMALKFNEKDVMETWEGGITCHFEN